MLNTITLFIFVTDNSILIIKQSILWKKKLPTDTIVMILEMIPDIIYRRYEHNRLSKDDIACLNRQIRRLHHCMEEIKKRRK